MLSDEELEVLEAFTELSRPMALPLLRHGEVWGRGNPWGTQKYFRRNCLTCGGTGVADLPINDAIDLCLADFHLVSLYGDRLEDVRKGWKEAAEELHQTHQRVECPDCRPKLTLGDRVANLLFNGLIVVALGMLMVLLVWFLLYLAGEV